MITWVSVSPGKSTPYQKVSTPKRTLSRIARNSSQRAAVETPFCWSRSGKPSLRISSATRVGDGLQVPVAGEEDQGAPPVPADQAGEELGNAVEPDFLAFEGAAHGLLGNGDLPGRGIEGRGDGCETEFALPPFACFIRRHSGRAAEAVEALPLAERGRGEDHAIPAFVEMVAEQVGHLHGPDGEDPVAAVEDRGRDVSGRGHLLPDRLEGVHVLLEVAEGGPQPVRGAGVDAQPPARLRLLGKGELRGDGFQPLAEFPEVLLEIPFEERRMVGGQNHGLPR